MNVALACLRIEQDEVLSSFDTISPKMEVIFGYVDAISVSSEPVLITGESGTGKELIAQAIHQLSCPAGPFVAVNAAGLDDQVFADTLFGHVRGAYTGAQEARKGMIEEAAGGVLFLDEIGELSTLADQAPASAARRGILPPRERPAP